jgi:hypothetical protein
VADAPGEVAASGGEHWDEEHGFYDGQYWAQAFAVGGTDEQLGFVEGYLTCNHSLAHDHAGVFSKTPAAYRMLISQWYAFDSQTGDIDRTRATEKIPDVLRRFRDNPS